MLKLVPRALILFSKMRGGTNSKGGGAYLKGGGALFRLSIFSPKMTLSLLLFKTKLQHKNSKTLMLCAEMDISIEEMSSKPVRL